MDQSFSTIPGWGSDADFSRRPGVPRMKPGSVPATHENAPPSMPGAENEVHPPDTPVTPVFGTSVPIKRTMPSGWLKRLAYRIPQDKSEHWMLLILSDRFDVLEHRLKPIARLALLAAGTAFAVGVVEGATGRRLLRRA